jgi:hypothetical protein
VFESRNTLVRRRNSHDAHAVDDAHTDVHKIPDLTLFKS